MEKYKILVPVDFSDRSLNALRNALMVAKRTDSVISVLHAVVAPVVYDEPQKNGDQLANDLDVEIEYNLNHLLELVPELKGFDHHFNVEYGLSPEVIADYTLANEVDLIVMGTRGKNQQAKSLLGSNTWSVISNTVCPVLAIPEEAEFTEAKKIILAIDYDQIPPFESFKPLVKMANIFGAQINIIHIGKAKGLSKEEISGARVLEQYLKSIKHQYKYIQAGNEEDAIIKYLKDENARLLAIISKKHSIVQKLQHQSLTKQMIRDLKTPLLVLHQVTDE